MANRSKSKGDSAEREAAALIHELTGWPARRKLGAGRHDDVGDIDGVPATVVQVVNRQDVAAALRLKVPACMVQQARAGATFGCVFVRRRGGGFYVAMAPEQWATYARESLAVGWPAS